MRCGVTRAADSRHSAAPDVSVSCSDLAMVGHDDLPDHPAGGGLVAKHDVVDERAPGSPALGSGVRHQQLIAPRLVCSSAACFLHSQAGSDSNAPITGRHSSSLS